ncbi:hypothetical protein [Mesobacillus stamsii]|uniref:YopX protein domain-containing protein n=1 Tax=Mesobacillus stamsii TaxID=225347 RepID=A0ABU0FTM7_9BACI|nr:hypothetical protein [Mesobacillus stamsii]MDQ0412689.1 hypothetical protein [Mesobacillus stamsii]
MFKLGQEVKFNKRYVKSGESVPNEVDYMNEEQKEKWENGEDILIEKLKMEDLGEYRAGIVVGKRNVGISSLLTWHDNEYVTNPHWKSIETTYETVYLVATNLKGFHKVPEKELHSL